jgi:MYXO-CTERM domain-containing protein
MSFGAPLWLLLLALLPVVWMLLALVARQRVIEVAWLDLWKDLDPGPARTRRLVPPPPTLFGLLVLASSVLLILSLARPRLLAEGEVRTLVIVVDRSASTAARDGRGRSVLDVLGGEARRILASSGAGTEIVVLAAPDGAVIHRGSVGAAASALDSLETLDLPDRWRAVLEEAARSTSAMGTRTLVLSDAPPEPGLPLLRLVPSLEWWVASRSGRDALPSRGIVGMRLEMEESSVLVAADVLVTGGTDPVAGGELVIEEVTPGDGSGSLALVKEIERHVLDPDASGFARVVTRLEGMRAPLFRLRLLPGGDALAVDDAVVAVPGGGKPLLVGMEEESPSLERALELLPAVEVLLLSGSEAPGKLAIDVHVVGPRESRSVGETPTIVIDPDGTVTFPGSPGEASPRVEVGESAGRVALAPGPDATPLEFGGDLESLELPLARPLVPVPASAFEIVAVGHRGEADVPLILRRGRHLVLGFDPEASTWPREASFPIFWANHLARLGAGPAEAGYPIHRTGEVTRLSCWEEGVASLDGPGGKRSVTSEGGEIVVVADRVGTYRLLRPGAAPGNESLLRFDLLDAGETRQAGEVQEGGWVLGAESGSEGFATTTHTTDLSRGCAWAALAVLLALVFLRRRRG